MAKYWRLKTRITLWTISIANEKSMDVKMSRNAKWLFNSAENSVITKKTLWSNFDEEVYVFCVSLHLLSVSSDECICMFGSCFVCGFTPSATPCLSHKVLNKSQSCQTVEIQSLGVLAQLVCLKFMKYLRTAAPVVLCPITLSVLSPWMVPGIPETVRSGHPHSFAPFAFSCWVFKQIL